MKKILFVFSLVAAASIALVSCQPEVQPHEPGEPEVNGCYGVYFPTQDASGDHVYNPTQDKVIDITVARTNTNGAITVPVKMSFSEDGVFEAAPVTFADGQEETTFAVRFDNAKEGVNYTANFVIDDNQYASKYNAGAIGLDFSVLCVEMKTLTTEDGSKVANVTFTDDVFWGEIHDEITIQYYEVDNIRYCQTVGGKLKGPDNGTVGEGPWGTGCQMSFKWYPKKTVEIDGVEYQFVEVLPNYIGYDSANGPVYMGDYFHMRADMGVGNGSYESSYDRYTNGSDGYNPSYYDGHGGFVFNSAYWIHGTTSWYGYKDNCPVAVAEGYLRVNYDFELESDYCINGVAPIYVTAGADVASIKYAVYPGELTATQAGNKIDAIAAGTEAATEFNQFQLNAETKKNEATLGITAEKTGIYTLVAVAYDGSKKAQNSASVVFNYISAADDATYAVKVDVFTEDTPARYKELHDYDSFAYCVSGSDLTDVHVAIYSADVVSKYGAEVIKADAKADEDGDYELSADQLAEVNADGGFYDIATGMKPNTTYYVVVWATNGSLEEYAVDAYTTAKLPYVWKSLGKGQYTDDVACGLYGADPITVSCDVEVEQSNPGLYRLSGFQLPLVAVAYGMTEAAISAYEGVVWRNSPIIIDASDPTSVFIELQDYGVCFNTSDGFIDGVTSVYNGKPFSKGILKDGVITFPEVKGLLCTLDGGYYYANQHGAFKLVLPAGQASAPAYAGPVIGGTTPAQKVFYAPVKVKYERDPKAVSVDVKVSYDRKARKPAFSEDSIKTVK